MSCFELLLEILGGIAFASLVVLVLDAIAAKGMRWFLTILAGICVIAVLAAFAVKAWVWALS